MKKLFAIALCLIMALSVLPALAATSGTYTGEGTGNNTEVKIAVEVTFADDAITEINVVSHEETPGISDPAFATIPDAVIAAQSLAVDTVSGATNTSKGLLAAIEDAAVKAGADVDALKAVAVETVEVEKTETEETTDILVIGAGVAGMSAALAARESGLEVTVIDKMAAVGGTTTWPAVSWYLSIPICSRTIALKVTLLRPSWLTGKHIWPRAVLRADIRTGIVLRAFWRSLVPMLTGWFPMASSLIPLPMQPAQPIRWHWLTVAAQALRPCSANP